MVSYRQNFNPFTTIAHWYVALIQKLFENRDSHSKHMTLFSSTWNGSHLVESVKYLSQLFVTILQQRL